MSETAPSPSSETSGPPGGLPLWTPSPKTLLILAAVLLAVVLATFWTFLSAQFRFALRYPADWGHTLIIPGIAASFVWMRRKELLAEPFRPAWTGLPILAAGVGLYILCTFGPGAFALHHNARGFAFGISLFGLCLLLFGWRAMRHLWFPIAYVVAFGQTVTDRILNVVTFRLQDISARGAEIVLNLIGIDTDRAGNTLTVWRDGMPHPLNVAEACSGMRMLLAFLALGVAIAYTGLKQPWQRVALVLLGVPVAVAVNVLRVVSLGMLSMVDSNLISGEFHNFVGLVWLVPALMIFLGIMWILRRMVVEEPIAAGKAES
ncbi:MAG: exosortase/archaeosortase family protein [Phycisphaerales bacterium]|jgi:exosortase